MRCLKIGDINQAPPLQCREVQSLSLSDNGEAGVNICWEKKNKLEVVRRCYNNPDIVRRPQPGADTADRRTVVTLNLISSAAGPG